MISCGESLNILLSKLRYIGVSAHIQYPRGLGLSDLSSWNIVCISRTSLVFFLCGGSIWVAWVTTYTMKSKYLWTIPPLSNSPWF
ncbi:hypothetical protein LINPERPRIM_LOCUS20556 [Linum perenne]